MNKKAMEISINALAAIILGIMILGAGIVLLTNIMNKGHALDEGLSSQVKQQIINSIDDNHPIYAYPKTINFPGDSASFGFGLTNIYPEERTFKFNVTAVDIKDQPNIQFLGDEFTMKSKAKKTFQILVTTKELSHTNHNLKIVTEIKDGSNWKAYYNESVHITYN